MNRNALTRLIIKQTLCAMLPWLNDVKDREALLDIVNDKHTLGWLIATVKDAEEEAGYIFRSEGSVDWSVPGYSTTEWEFAYGTWLYPSKASFAFEFRWGKAVIKKWEPDMVRIKFDAKNEKVNFYFRYKIFIQISSPPHTLTTDEHDNPDPFLVRERIFYHWSVKPIFVPLKIIACWMEGNLEDWDNEIVASGSDEYAVIYDSVNYPLPLCDLFQTLRLAAFRELFRYGCLSKEDYRLINYRLIRMGLYPPPNYPETPQDQIAKASTIKTIASNTQKREEVSPRVLYLRMKPEYRERLKKIEEIGPAPLSYAQWVFHFRLKSKSRIREFFTSMVEEGLLDVAKTEAGTAAVLTQKAKDMLAAAF